MPVCPNLALQDHGQTNLTSITRQFCWQGRDDRAITPVLSQTRAGKCGRVVAVFPTPASLLCTSILFDACNHEYAQLRTFFGLSTSISQLLSKKKTMFQVHPKHCCEVMLLGSYGGVFLKSVQLSCWLSEPQMSTLTTGYLDSRPC